MIASYIDLLVPRELVKTVKSRLEECNQLSKKRKISQCPPPTQNGGQIARFVIPTTVSFEAQTAATAAGLGAGLERGSLAELHVTYIPKDQATLILKSLNLLDYNDRIDVILCLDNDAGTSYSNAKSGNPVQSAISQWLHTLPESLVSSLGLTVGSLVSDFPTTYSVYDPMLLLPAHSFKSTSWDALLGSLSREDLQKLYRALGEATHSTHVAINAPIPPVSGKSHESARSNSAELSNILRSPVNISPLYGDFGTAPSSQTLAKPTEADFSSALWVTTTQNGIHQIWAPLYTMFSRGNIREKSRLLHLPTVRSLGGPTNGEWTAVDLYSGVGYFAFSYAKAGARHVICWELNPWSIEGMRRGAEKNKWKYLDGSEGLEKVASELRDQSAGSAEGPRTPLFLVFPESNEHAGMRIPTLREHLPPIRHVNLGLLPTSAGAYGVAVQAVDPSLGGWLHVHENISAVEQEMRKKCDEVIAEIQSHLESHHRPSSGSDVTWVVQLEHIEKVKTYAPGVIHCVLDIWVGPENGA